MQISRINNSGRFPPTKQPRLAPTAASGHAATGSRTGGSVWIARNGRPFSGSIPCRRLSFFRPPAQTASSATHAGWLVRPVVDRDVVSQFEPQKLTKAIRNERIGLAAYQGNLSPVWPAGTADRPSVAPDQEVGEYKVCVLLPFDLWINLFRRPVRAFIRNRLDLAHSPPLGADVIHERRTWRRMEKIGTEILWQVERVSFLQRFNIRAGGALRIEVSITSSPVGAESLI